jgi:DNA-binding MarR family transcriptional regulator
LDSLFALIAEGHWAHITELELTLPQAQAIRLLRREEMTTTAMATALGISAPAVTQLADRLSAKALIERHPSSRDRRSVVITLTVEGRAAVDSLRLRRNRVFEELLARLIPADRAQVIQALALLAQLHRGEEDDLQLKPAAPSTGPPREIRTASALPPASNEYGRTKATGTVVRRKMRIEWD